MGIRESRAAYIQDGYYMNFLNDETYTPAQRQYLFNIHDPNGRPWREAYYSFRKGQEAREAEAERVAEEFGVTVKHLQDAVFTYMGRILGG